MDKISIDWLSFTYRVQSEDDFIPIFDLICTHLKESNIEWREKSGVRGYSNGGVVLDGLGFVAYSPKLLRQGVHVTLSSSALNILENRHNGIDGLTGEMKGFNVIDWLSRVFNTAPTMALDNEIDEKGNKIPFVKVTRIDFALDDLSGIINIDECISLCELREQDSNYVTTRFKSYEVIRSGWAKTGKTLYLGSRSSEAYLRIYDKAAEQNSEGLHWARVEIEYKADRARQILEYVLSTKSLDCVCRSILNYVAFKSPPVGSDSFERWPIVSWWLEFLQVDEVLVLAFGNPSSTIEKAVDWIDKQVAPTLALVQEAYGDEKVKRLINSGSKRLNEKHYAMLKVYRDGLYDEIERDEIEQLLVVVSDLGGVIVGRSDADLDFADWVAKKEYEFHNRPRKVQKQSSLRFRDFNKFNNRVKGAIPLHRFMLINDIGADDEQKTDST